MSLWLGISTTGTQKSTLCEGIATDNGKKTVVLKPGTYEYKFWVDGEWMLDAGNDNRCANNFGTVNSFVTVSPWQQ